MRYCHEINIHNASPLFLSLFNDVLTNCIRYTLKVRITLRTSIIIISLHKAPLISLSLFLSLRFSEWVGAFCMTCVPFVSSLLEKSSSRGTRESVWGGKILGIWFGYSVNSHHFSLPPFLLSRCSPICLPSFFMLFSFSLFHPLLHRFLYYLRDS
jgi:hypothetical protein